MVTTEQSQGKRLQQVVAPMEWELRSSASGDQQSLHQAWPLLLLLLRLLCPPCHLVATMRPAMTTVQGVMYLSPALRSLLR